MKKNISLILLFLLGSLAVGAVYAAHGLGIEEGTRVESPVRQLKEYRLSDSEHSRLDFDVQDEEKLLFTSRIAIIDDIRDMAVLGMSGFDMPKESGVPDRFCQISLDGYVLTQEEGFPSLPVRMEMIEIPQGATPRVVYQKVEFVDVPLASLGVEGPILPAQALREKNFSGTLPFRLEAEAYSRDYFVVDIKGKEFIGDDGLVQIIEDGMMRDSRLGRVLVSPVRYNAVSGTLRVFTVLDFEIIFDNADFVSTSVVKQKYSSPFFRLSDRVINPLETVRTKAQEYQSPVSYVIVADTMFKDALQDFVEWKTRLGFQVTEAYLGENGLAKDTVSIKNYLKGLYQNADENNPAPSFILLVGDVDQLPAHLYVNPLTSTYNPHVSDLYYAEYTGDKMPEVAYGRMSATTVEELEPQLEKTMYMEGLTLENAGFLKNAIAIAGFDMDHGDSHLNPTVNYIDGEYLSKLHENTYKYLYPESQNRENDIISNINNGVGFVFYTAHGLAEGWVNPDINKERIPDMTNKGMYPLMVGNCCLTGKFDSRSCFGESLLRAKDAGAVSYIGATNNTYFPQDVTWAIGFPSQGFLPDVQHAYENTGFGAMDAWCHTHDEDYSKWAQTAYDIVRSGNIEVQRAYYNAYVEYYWQVYHVFGDPSYMPYSQMAQPMDVVYGEAVSLGSTSYKVSTVPYARVVLSKGKNVIGVATANAQGEAELHFEAISVKDSLDLTVVAQNRITFMTTVKVMDEDAQYAGAIGVDYKLGETSVSQSGDFAYGNIYEAYFTVSNMGKEKIDKLEMKVVPLDSYLQVEEESFVLEQTIEPGEELRVDHAFRIRVSPNSPDRYQARYKVISIADGVEADSAVHMFEMHLRSTELALYDLQLFNEAGDRCHVLGTNQTLKARMMVRNAGDFEAGDVSLRLSTSSGYLVLPSEEFELGTMAAGAIDTVEFDITSKVVQNYYETYRILLSFTSRGREMTDSVDSYIEPFTEDFESGNFLAVNWDETSDWEIDETHVYEGKYSAGSASGLEDNQSSSLWMMFNTPYPDKVSFRYSVSTEMSSPKVGDFLVFSVNGEEKGRWGGLDEAWKYASFDVPKGEVILEWKYIKDSDSKDGKDRVWVDNIVLPMGVTLNPDMDLKPDGASNQSGQRVQSDISVISSGDRLLVNFESGKSLEGDLFLVNVMGREVRSLDKGLRLSSGYHQKEYSLSGLPQGFYICVFQTVDGRQAVKFVKM